MKLVQISDAGKKKYGLVAGEKFIDSKYLAEVLNTDLPEDFSEFIQSWARLQNSLQMAEEHLSHPTQDGLPLDRVRILAPVIHPPKIICLGLNYATHVNESNANPPSEPIVFMKPRTTIIGPHDDIVSPSITHQLDYEVELAVVIGKECKRIGENDALDYVLGYMVLNDVTARDLQRRERQWFRAKGLDTYAPTGPWIVTKDELNIDDIRLTTKVNGELRQDGSTKDMIFKVKFLISWLSQGMTLEPGDIISTGTPSGVGVYMKQPTFLKEGDTVEAEVEGIGSLRNRVRFE